MANTAHTRTKSNLLLARLIPDRFLAAQLRKPSGLFGRVVMTRGLNQGNAQLLEQALSVLALRDGESFLDVGFGGGRALNLAAKQTRGALWGADFSADAVREGHHALRDLIATGQLNLITADVTSLPLRDGLVDTIFTTNTIYFWPDLAPALSELRRVLTGKGRLVIGYSGREKMERFNNITRYGFRMFVPQELETALAQSGFRAQTTALHGDVTEGDFVTSAQPL